MTDRVPMFPLGTVLLPHNALPLHVFETRYRAMIETVLDGDHTFGVVLIERGSEVGGDDVRTDVGCRAHIEQIEKFSDGRYALVALGTERFRVQRWLPDDPHPWADIEPWHHGPALPDAGELMSLLSILRRTLALAAELGEPVAPATVELDLDPAPLVDVACGLAPVGPLDRQRLLTAPDRAARAALLEQLLQERMVDLQARLDLR